LPPYPLVINMEEIITGDLQQDEEVHIVDKLKREIDKLKANVDRLADRLLEEKAEKDLLKVLCDRKDGKDSNQSLWPIEEKQLVRRKK